MVQALSPSHLSGLHVEVQVTVTEDRIQRYPRLHPQLRTWHRFSVLCRASTTRGLHHPLPQGSSQRWFQEEALPTQKPLVCGLNSFQGFWTLGNCEHWQLLPLDLLSWPGVFLSESLSKWDKWGWCFMAVIPAALRELRQENCRKFKASLGFIG